MTDPIRTLRRRAEAALQQNLNRPGEELATMSPSAVQEMLHNLHVHQIELEMQNEELRRARDELDASQARYFDFYDLAPVGYCTVSESGQILQANLTAASLWGIARDTLPGQWIDLLFSSQDRDACYLFRQRLIQTRELQSQELRLLVPDRPHIWVRLDAISVVDEAGVRQLRVVLTNINDQKIADAALVESQDRYRNLVENTSDLITSVDADGRFVFVNGAAKQVFELTPQECIGLLAFDFVHPQDRQATQDAFGQWIASSTQPFIFENRQVGRSGAVHRMQWSVVPRYSTTGDVCGFDSVARDITERQAIEATLKAARQQAERESQAKSRFLASASHDLRQPAHALGMFVARLSELPNDAQTKHLVDCMEASVRAMQDMLDGFFDISRLDFEQGHTNKVVFPINDVFNRLRLGFSGAALDKGLRMHIRPSKAWIETDQDLLSRALVNLISNAIRYTQEGSILVACRPTGDGKQLRIEVRDSGIGIAPQYHEEIFQEFFQIQNPQRDRSKGLGLGLSIVSRISSFLNHPLALHSNPGCGTRFTLTVPVGEPRADEQCIDINKSSEKVDFCGLRALLIEDDSLCSAGLATLLTSWGFSVVVAEGAQMACDLYRHDEAPDVIISDFRLAGGINGIEGLEMLSAIAGRRIAACMISGDIDASVRQQSQAAGLTLLQKPVRPAKLRNLLRHLVQPTKSSGVNGESQP